jgi:hypothetical protein
VTESCAPRRTATWVATGLLTALGAAVAVTAAATTTTLTEPVGASALGDATGGAVSAPLPALSTSNVRHLTTVPDTAAISLEFARRGDFAYASSLDTISVLDLADPRKPRVRGTLVNAMFENEAMTYGERKVGQRIERFVIAAIDLYQASPGDVTRVNVASGPEVVIVDVTDPDNPFIRSRTTATTSTHTVQCLDQEDCRYAYSAGGRGSFSILDLTDLDAPREVATAASPAAGPNPVFSRGAGHYWDFDGVLGWHTGSGGAAAFDVSDPLRPVLVNSTDEAGRTGPLNDFILHNSMRPNAAAFTPGAEPSLRNGNVLLVTEEDYANDGDEVLCDRAGSFSTWYVDDLDPARTGGSPTGSITPLDSVTVSDLDSAVPTPAAAFCSAHWFDVHQDGFVAQGWYGAGLRILDVRDPRSISQLGYSTGVATEVWDAYWVPQRNRNGVATGAKTNLVYTADAVRGIDVYEVALPTAR